MRYQFKAVGMAIAFLASVPAYAAVDEKYPQDEYNKHIMSAQTVGALGNDMFGEQVNFFTGAAEFRVTDISIPGQGPAVAIGRRFEVKDRGNVPMNGAFADWDLDIPHLHGVFAAATLSGVDWIVSTAQPTLRCSTPTSALDAAPPTREGTQGGLFDAIEYWAGNRLYVPGQGDQSMLLAVAGNPNKPATGGPYRWVTTGQWYFSCLPGSGSGETFLAIDPNGTRYWFDHVVMREAPILKKPYASPLGLTSSESNGSDSSNQPQYVADYYFIKRQEVWMLPTRIEDRFGNAVTYTYNPAAPWQLTQIAATDGRQLTLTYTNGVVSSISDGQRTWAYTYSGRLTTATYPDGSKWAYNLEGLRQITIEYEPSSTPNHMRECDDPGFILAGGGGGSITHPSGATGTFVFSPVRMGRSYVPKNLCRTPDDFPRDAIYPVQFDNLALVQKQIAGPGLATATWDYAWGPANFNYAEDCTSSQCPSTRTVTVNGPTGWLRYTHSNKFFDGEGKLLLTEEGETGAGTPLRSTETEYLLSPAGQAYPAQIGIDANPLSDAAGEQHQPTIERTITQQGRSFTWQVATGCGGTYCFDQFARPTKVVKASLPNYSRTEVTTYHDNTTKWVLGQTASVSCVAATPYGEACDGDVVSSTTFDSTSALPLTVAAFGKLQSTMTYYADGTLQTVKDGNNRITTFSSWKRGIPQSIAFADSTSRSAVVNDLGWIMSSTDENGYTTSYGYDSMGRVASITHPTGDSTTWINTTRNFILVGNAEYGIAGGHWREWVKTGNAIKVTYYDAAWRPLLVREYDSTNMSGTQRFTRKAFDADGRSTFSSYPSTSASAYTGVWMEYDALGRVASVAQDTELTPALQVTTTSYNAGFTTTVTNPRGASTTTHYMTHDQPTTDWPTIIAAPEGVTTTIDRDPFGKPLSITRGEAP